MAVSAIACLAFVLLLASHPAAAHSTRSAAPPAQLARSVFHDDDAPPAPTAPYNYTCSGACSRPVRSCTKASPCAGGTVLMGGGPDVADAFAWQVQQGRGGDFLVLRADGTGAYNDWVMQVTKANSAATLCVPGAPLCPVLHPPECGTSRRQRRAAVHRGTSPKGCPQRPPPSHTRAAAAAC